MNTPRIDTLPALALIVALTGTCARPTHPAELGGPSLELQLREDIGVLAHDSLRGRGTPSPGLDAAARYVAAELAAAGAQPFQGGDFVHNYPLAETEIIPQQVSVSFPPYAPLRLGPTLVLLNDHGGPADVEGEVVLLTGRITDSALAHVDLSTAMLVIPRATLHGLDRITQVSGPVMAGNPHAMVFVSDVSDSIMNALNTRPPSRRWGLGIDPLDLRPPVRVSHGIFVMRPDPMAPVLSAQGIDLNAVLADTTGPFTVRRLTGQRMRVVGPRRQLAQATAPVVAGVIPGRDPARRDEYVVVSAHLDHLGVGTPVEGDSIYNGADDNASGVAVLLAVARQMGARGEAPLRSVLFVATSGEEVGHWGGDYFVGSRSTPIDRFVANINIDGVGRAAWPDSMAVLGGAWSTLGAVAEEAATRANVGIRPSFLPHATFSSSDQYSFARRGVPSVHLYSGKLNAYYHAPADEFEVIDFDWLGRVARYAYEIVTVVANDPSRPVWTDPYHASGKVPW